MKIYTKTGDDGSTGLFGGQRVTKADARIDCYGTIDELNAVIGWTQVAADADLSQLLRLIQNELFVIGSHLATPEESPAKSNSLPPLDRSMIDRLEEQIDQAESLLAPLKNFILPGGTEAASRLHVTRTVCRRAERLLVSFAQLYKVDGTIVIYLNRLSDWLFVQARAANHRAGVSDILWMK